MEGRQGKRERERLGRHELCDVKEHRFSGSRWSVSLISKWEDAMTPPFVSNVGLFTPGASTWYQTRWHDHEQRSAPPSQLLCRRFAACRWGTLVGGFPNRACRTLSPLLSPRPVTSCRVDLYALAKGGPRVFSVHVITVRSRSDALSITEAVPLREEVGIRGRVVARKKRDSNESL